MTVELPTWSSLNSNFDKLELGEFYKWSFKEDNNSRNGGRLNLWLSITATQTSKGLHVMLSEEDGNYAGACYIGLFEDTHSAVYFAMSLMNRFNNSLQGTVEEKNGIY